MQIIARNQSSKNEGYCNKKEGYEDKKKKKKGLKHH